MLTDNQLPSGESLLSLLRQHWRHQSFRPQQEEIIRSVLGGKDTLALLPTGSGKSLCFQVPALARPGLCLVVSPLIALMKDQVDSLRRKNITAFFLHTGMNRRELVSTLQTAADSNCKFLYVSPERLETDLFAEWLPALDVRLIAVDEAHCVSQWGYDFRPSYLRIAALRSALPGVPLLALTASATPRVMTDIADKLELKEPAVFRQAFTRPNLSYSFFREDNKIRKVTEILGKVAGSGIVYCKTRRSTREISDWLTRQGIPAAAYHAGLSREERDQRQEDWLRDRIRVIVSTNAFGMGIDKSDVRTVIHADVPESIESYYQESGRAGRDGMKAYAVLLATAGDIGRLDGLPEIRFPPLTAVREVYQHLMNYLQLPSSAGEGQYYDFDLADFCRRFECEISVITGILRLLEQDGLLSFQQQVSMPARVQFITAKQALYDFEAEHPGLQPVIHGLLRGYEGIFDGPVFIRERQLAHATRREPPQLATDLAQLEAFRIIEYKPPKEMPQLYFFRDRAPAEELYIDPVRYRERKEVYADRIRTMIRYLNLKGECRSRYLAGYFGDREAGDCGICDNCLHAKGR
ncbi:MAG TPA: ATP-dependent DNA helicase RecQ [Puia sp.]|jgi:ATP-dependent DNA helicase RecQ|nr:ATP-dependent DNA helicase RecQ [Puia sp.]